MSSQTVYFNNPSSITNLQQSVGTTPGVISTSNITATGTVTAGNVTVLGNVTVGNSNILQMQDQIYNLQAAVNPSQPSAGGMNTQSFFGANTQPNQIYRTGVDDSGANHFYDLGGLSSENLQYLQLDSSASIPTTWAQPFGPIMYQNNTGTYIFGSSNNALYFTGSAFSTNINRATRREQFNLLQDIGCITGTYAGYTGFTQTFGGGFVNPLDIWRLGNGLYTEGNISNNAYDSTHIYGQVSSVWRYDVNTKTVIARSMPNMAKALWSSGTGSDINNWRLASNSDGFMSSLGNDMFVINIYTPATYGLLVFDINLNPLNLFQVSAFGGISSESPNVTPTNFGVQSQANAISNITYDQVRGSLVRKFGFAQLGTGSYTSLVNGSKIDVFNGNTGSQATFIYVWSSSQASYNSADYQSNFNRISCVTPLSNAKFDYTQGKVTCFALCTGAPSSATGIYASNNGQYLVPIMQYRSTPDDYVSGDRLQQDSFAVDPITGQYVSSIDITYPLVDIRDQVIYATGAFRNVSASSTGSWREGYTQFVFSSGSSTGSSTAGIQRMCVSIYCNTGSDTIQALISDYGNRTITMPRSRRYFQDVYGQTYYQYTDATGTYFQQNYILNGSITLTDEFVRFYVSPTVQYVDTQTSVSYVQQSDGSYKNAGNSDPSPNAQVRQLILNNGFAVRHGFTNYKFTTSFTGGVGQIMVTNAGSQVSSTNQFNPIPPPISNKFNNAGSLPIYADFNMPHGTAFDITQQYISQPFSLTFTDWSPTTGAYNFTLRSDTISSLRYNTNYGGTGLYDVNNILRYMTGVQSGLTTPVIEVLTEGTYTVSCANFAGSYTVPAGSIAFKVLGEVFNGQPIKMTFSQSNINNLVLTDWMAKQLNYYGGGVYGNVNTFQDSNGEDHLIVGNGNAMYIPLYENLMAGNYAARQFIADKNAGLLPASAATLRILGLDNIQATPGLSPVSVAHQISTAIYNTNGKYVFDCSCWGIQAFEAQISNLALGIYASGAASSTNYYSVPNFFTGGLRSIGPDVCLGPYHEYMYYSNVYGELPTLTSDQAIEMWNLICLLRNYHQRYMSNRRRACLFNNTAQVNTKTMKVEQIVRGYQNFPATFIAAARDVNIVDSFMLDSYTANIDEVEGAVTAGKTYIYQKGKTQNKLWRKDLATNGAQCVSVSYNGKSRFACSYDGALGAQFDKSSTGTTLLTTSTKYGNVCEYNVGPEVASCPNSCSVYLGQQGGKDIFATVPLGPGYGISANTLVGMSIFPLNNAKFVDTDRTQNNSNPYVISNDNKLVKYYNTSNATRYNQLSSNFPANYAYSVATARIFSSLTMNDTETGIKYLYHGVIPNAGHYELFLNTGAVGTFNLAAVTPSDYTTAILGKKGGGLINGTPRVINDLLCFTYCDTLRFYRIDTGEFLGSIYGTDVMFDESWLPELVSSSAASAVMTQQNQASFGCQIYANGNLYVQAGCIGRGNNGGVGRHLLRFNLKYNTPQALNLTSLFVSTGSVGSYNSQTVVFTPQDAISQNNNQWCLLTTFRTTNFWNQRKPEYPAIDDDYNSLYHSGITAIAIYDPTNIVLSTYQTPSLDISTKFINGGSWYARTGISFKTLLASGVVKFLYAGQIPYKCRAQTPYTISEDQVNEAVQVRRQKRLLSEYYRAKNGSTAPYPDNGLYVDNSLSPGSNVQYTRTVTQRPYLRWQAITDPNQSVTYNQSLGYTDVGTGRPLPTPL